MAGEGQIRGQDIINEDVFAKLAALDQGLARILTRMNEIQAAGQRANSNTTLSGVSQRSIDLNKEANVLLIEQKKLEDNLIRTRARSKLSTEATARALAKQRVELQIQNKEVKRAATLASDYAGAYTKLSTQLNIAKDRLKDLIVTQGAGSQASIKQAAEVDKLAARIKLADNAAGDFQRNVGNYPSALKPVVGVIRQLVGAFGIVEGLRLGSRIVRETIAIAREAKGVEFAFDNIGEAGEKAFDKIRKSTRGLLSNLEIQRAIVEFDNFRLNADDLSTVLEFVTLRATQTGKSFEFLKNSAIEAITKESVLRADNLGLSQKALNEEIDKGATFLEAFGNIAKRELGRAGNILDDATNSAAKFSASVENLEVAFGKLFLNTQGFSAASGFADFFNLLAVKFDQINFALTRQISLFERYQIVTRTYTIEGMALNQQLIDEAEARDKATKAIQGQIDAYIRLNGTLGPLQEKQEEITGSGGGFGLFAGAAAQAAPRLLADINKELEVQLGLLDEGNFSTREQAKAIQDKIDALQAEKDAILGIVDVEQKRLATQKNSIQFYQDTINSLKELQSKTAKNTEEYKRLQRAIDEAEGSLLSIQGEFDAPNLVITPGKVDLSNVELIGPDDGEIFQDIDNFLNTDGIAAGMETLAQRLGANQQELVDEFAKYYEQDFKNFQEYAKLKIEQAQVEKETRLEIAGEIAAGIGDIGNALFDAAEDRADREVERQNEVLDSIINNKNATEEQVEIAQKKRDENEKKRQKEREKRERQAFLFNQAIQVAEVFISDALARSRATAQSFLLPPAVSQAYLASMQGLISIQTGVALATILAQTLPKFFFQGKGLEDTYEGPGVWGERRREVKIGADGQVEVSPNKATPLWVKKDDLILKSVPEFHSAMRNPNSDAFKRVASTLSRDTRQRTQVITPQGYNGDGVERAIKRGFKGIRHDIKIINKWPEQRLTKF